MDLDKLRDNIHRRKLNDKQAHEMDALILDVLSRMKRADQKHRRMLKRMLFLYVVFTLIYVILFLASGFDHKMPRLEKMGWWCFIGAFSYFSVFLGIYIYRYGKTHYDITSYEHLRKMADRYRLFQPRLLLIFPVLILVNLGSVLLRAEKNLTEYIFSDEFWVLQGFFWGVIAIAFLFGYRDWRKKSMPVYHHAKKLLSELGE